MGFVSFMHIINDPEYRLKVDKEFPKMNFFKKILFFLSGLVYVPIMVGILKFIKSDKATKRMNEMKQKDNHNSKFFASQEFPFDDVKKCYKRFGTKTTFNDYMMGIMSVSLSKWFKKYGIEDAKELNTLVSVNTRGLPKTLEDFRLENDSVGIKFLFPIMSDFEKAIQETPKNFKKFFTPFSILCSKNFAYTIPFLPTFIQEKLVEDVYFGVDMVYSNVPLSSEPWCILGKKVSKTGVFAHQQHNWKLFYVATTY
jgi:hypothetical protein